MGAVGVANLFLGGLGVMNVMLISFAKARVKIASAKSRFATRESIPPAIFLETVSVVAWRGGKGLSSLTVLCDGKSLPMPRSLPVFCWRAGK